MRPADSLIFGFLSFLFIITVLFKKQIPDSYSILSVYTVLIAALFLLTYFKKRHKSKILEITCDVILPVLVVVLVFDTLGSLIRHINPSTYDHFLIQLDYMIFNVHPTVALERFTAPVATELLQLAYISYYFMPIILGVTLKIKGKETEFNRTVFLIILCFFLSYIGYILVPAVGPRYTMNHIQNTELHGIFLRDAINSTLNTLEGIKRDAFPSGHTAITLVVLYLAYRFQRLLFRIFLPFVLGLIISTVYLRYHYVVDVAAGVLLFAFTIYVGEKYYNYWEKRNETNYKSQAPNYK